ncbi:MAG TPA: GNAT family N-acetyltransferase [Candidatus Binatia bacterium]|nr:GNAT family N-acetyltransferase [Candidatus Binatia bacterium]
MTRIALSTARLDLAEWEPGDARGLRPIATDPEVMRHISGGVPWSDEQIQEFVQRQMRHAAERGFCLWKLLLREHAMAGEVAGLCGLQPLPGTDEIEIGWWLARELWGQGLATEAARAALQFAWQTAGLTRIVAIARPENRASRHVMEKLGMRYERDTVHKGIPVVLYSVERGPEPAETSRPGQIT